MFQNQFNLCRNVLLEVHNRHRHLHLIIHSSYHSFIILFIHRIFHSFYYSFILLFIHLITHSSYYSFILLFIHLIAHSSYYSFILLFIHFIVHSSYSSFILLFIHLCFAAKCDKNRIKSSNTYKRLSRVFTDPSDKHQCLRFACSKKLFE